MSALTKGCTLLSWLASKFGIILREEGCCGEHDLFYEQGGSIMVKFFADWKFSVCVYLVNGGGMAGFAKAALGWAVVSFNPYAWVTWWRA